MGALHEGVWIISVTLALCNEVRPVPRGLGEWNYEKHARSAPRSRPSAATSVANGSCRRPPQPSSETSRTIIPSGREQWWRNSPPGGWAPGLRHPLAEVRSSAVLQIRHSSRTRLSLGFPLSGTCRPRATLPGDETDGTCSPSLLASRGDPDRGLTAWVPPCSRSVQGSAHGSRLGFPGRRPPRVPAASGNVVRGIHEPPGERKKGEPPTRGTALPRLGSSEARSEGPRVLLSSSCLSAIMNGDEE